MRKITVTAIVAILAAAWSAAARADFDYAALRTLPVMRGGRLEALDTFARELAVAVTGSESYGGRDHMELLMEFLFDQGRALKEPLLYVRSEALKKKLGLRPGQTHFAVTDIVGDNRLSALLRASGPDAGTMNDVTELAAVIGRIVAVHAQLYMVPPAPGTEKWLSLADMMESQEPGVAIARKAFTAMQEAYMARDDRKFNAGAREFAAALKAVNPAAWPGETRMSLEVMNNEIDPMQKAWVIYFAGAALAGLMFFVAKGRVKWLPLAVIAAAVIVHSGGLVVRGVVAGRLPLGDMYESVVFTAWGAGALGLVLAGLLRRIYIAWAGAVVAGAALAAGGLLPGGTNVHAVSFVLRNNYWLTAHVATTLLGFGALALAAGLAHYAWCVYCFREKKAELFNSLSAAVWRVMQAGVVLLALGTVMGGFWASEAWGRFWGWDAKESWALITILVYVIILHARGCGWLREFGVVMGAIWGFLAVLMTWYGVNYLLGTGRHSYGFGRGGYAVALVALAAECLVVMAAMSLRSSRAAVALRGQPLTTENTE